MTLRLVQCAEKGADHTERSPMRVLWRLAPCPSSGLMINGSEDRVVSTEDVIGLVERLKTQKGVIIDHKVVPKANHFFENQVDELMQQVDAYLDMRLAEPEESAA